MSRSLRSRAASSSATSSCSVTGRRLVTGDDGAAADSGWGAGRGRWAWGWADLGVRVRHRTGPAEDTWVAPRALLARNRGAVARAGGDATENIGRMCDRQRISTCSDPAGARVGRCATIAATPAAARVAERRPVAHLPEAGARARRRLPNSIASRSVRPGLVLPATPGVISGRVQASAIDPMTATRSGKRRRCASIDDGRLDRRPEAVASDPGRRRDAATRQDANSPNCTKP